MAVPTNTEVTYSTTGIREDLKDFIANISPTDTPFQKMIGTDEATNTFFEWQIDQLDAPNTNNAALEGGDAIIQATTPPVRVGNRCQISTKTIAVSGTIEAVKKAGRAKQIAYEVRKRTLELKRDMEAILVQNQSSGAGNLTTARTTGSLEAWFTTNVSRGTGGANGGFSGSAVTAATDGTQRAFTESLLKTLLTQTFTAGGNDSVIMVGPGQKATASTFNGGATKFDTAEDMSVTSSLDFYTSDFGTLRVVPNRFQRNRTAFVLQPDMWKIAYLRPFQLMELAKTGDSSKKELLVEYGLMSMNEAASGVIADLL